MLEDQSAANLQSQSQKIHAMASRFEEQVWKSTGTREEYLNLIQGRVQQLQARNGVANGVQSALFNGANGAGAGGSGVGIATATGTTAGTGMFSPGQAQHLGGQATNGGRMPAHQQPSAGNPAPDSMNAMEEVANKVNSLSELLLLPPLATIMSNPIFLPLCSSPR